MSRQRTVSLRGVTREDVTRIRQWLEEDEETSTAGSDATLTVNLPILGTVQPRWRRRRTRSSHMHWKTRHT